MRNNSRSYVVYGAALALSLCAATSFAQPGNDPSMSATSADTSKSDQPVTDTWITTKVKSELLAAKNVEGTDINVSTKDGVVTLAGVLDTRESVNKAITVAKSVKGVRSVDTRALKSR